MNVPETVHILAEIFFSCIAPIKRNRIVITSFNGHYSDSPRYISQRLHELDNSLELVWLVQPKYRASVPDYVTAEPYGTIRCAWYRATAKASIDNVYGSRCGFLFESGPVSKCRYYLFRLFKRKNGQLLFSTWHGTPLKRIGRDQIGQKISDFYCSNGTMILNNQYAANILRHVTFGKMEITLLGAPRNDVLFADVMHRSEIKRKLGLPVDKRIVLFAPTFRNDGNNIENKNVLRSGVEQMEAMDISLLFRALSEKFGGEWAIVCRFHYHVEALVDWKRLRERFPNQVINGNEHDEMAEYLAGADVLITDASSCMFDYAITKKPCFLFFPDVENYQSTERGFYVDLNSLPFPLAKQFPDLLENIARYDETVYKKGVQCLIEEFGFVDDADSSSTIAQYIIERMKNTRDQPIEKVN